MSRDSSAILASHSSFELIDFRFILFGFKSFFPVPRAPCTGLPPLGPFLATTPARTLLPFPHIHD